MCPEGGRALVFVELPLTQACGVSPQPPGTSSAWDSLVWTERVQALRLHAGVESSEATMSHGALRSLSLNAPQQETDKPGGGLPLQLVGSWMRPCRPCTF